MKPHLPKKLFVALCLAITIVESSTFASEEAAATFTTTNSPDGNRNDNYNAPGFVLSLTGSRLATTSNPAGVPIAGCAMVNLVSLTANLRHAPGEPDSVGLAITDSTGTVRYLSSDSAASTGDVTWHFAEGTMVETDSSLYFLYYLTSNTNIQVGYTFNKGTDLYTGGAGSGGVRTYASTTDYASCTFLYNDLTPQNVAHAPYLSIVTTTVTACDEYVWAGTEGKDVWDTQTANWQVDGQTSAFQSGILSNATFGDGAVAKMVTVSEDIVANTVTVNDNYTFNVADGYTLTINRLSVATGKTASVTNLDSVSATMTDATINLNDATLAGDATLINTGTMTLDGTIVFGENAIQNNGNGTIAFGNNIHFDLTNMTAAGNVYTLFSGTGEAIDLSGFDESYITVAGGTEGYEWTFDENGKLYFEVLTPPTPPAPYTSVTITAESQLSSYTRSDYTAFLIGANIIDSSYRMTGAHQYWTDYAPHTHRLTFEEFGGYTNGGALNVASELIMEYMKELNFIRNSTATSPQSYGGAICGGNSSAIMLSDNTSVTFSENRVNSSPAHNAYYSNSYGGAIYGDSNGTITINGNNSVIFSKNYTRSDTSYNYESNSSKSYGGAIYGGSGCTITLAGNNGVAFSANYAVSYTDESSYSYGGAVYGGNRSTITLSGNNGVRFSGNYAASYSHNSTGTYDLLSSCGGAVYTEDGSSVSFNDNKVVTFDWNYARAQCISEYSIGGTSSYGGAIYGGSGSAITLNGNESVTFSGNYADAYSADSSEDSSYRVYHSNSYGGAIYGKSNGTITLSGNNSVIFSGNYASSVSTSYSASSSNKYYHSNSYGGAIYGGSNSTITLSDNGSVMFSENYISTIWSDSCGGAICATNSNICFTRNETVVFNGNYAASTYGTARGGAICGSNVSIVGNGSVTFRGNYEQSGSRSDATYRLRSVYADGGSLELAAGEGQNITFYDTLCASYNATLSLNAQYQDKDGVMRNATGDIVFSGKYTEDDLEKLKPNYTQQELMDSLTTEVYTTTNLYGGRLCIEDGAVYKGRDIVVAPDSQATLRLAGSTLNLFGYIVTLNGSTTLEAAGEDYITADKLDLKDGSRMKLAAGAKLDVNGTISFTAPQETTWSVEGGAEITADKMSGNGSTISSLNNVNVDIIDNYTIEDMSISGSVIDISEGTTLYVKHVNIEADARITDEAAWLDMVDTHGWLDNSNTEASAPVMSLGDTLFYRSGDDAWIRLNQDVSYVALTSELFSNVTLTGSDLWLDLTGLVDTIGNAQAFSIAFKDALYDVNGLRVVATVDGEHYLDGYYTTKQEGTTTTLYFSAQIPEPTTSTLSLLALAALASRRRKQ